VKRWYYHGNAAATSQESLPVYCMDHCKCSEIHQWHTSTDIYTCTMSGRPHHVWISSSFCWYRARDQNFSWRNSKVLESNLWPVSSESHQLQVLWLYLYKHIWHHRGKAS